MFLKKTGEIDIYKLDDRLAMLPEEEVKQLLTEHLFLCLKKYHQEKLESLYHSSLSGNKSIMMVLLTDVLYRIEIQIAELADKIELQDIDVEPIGVFKTFDKEYLSDSCESTKTVLSSDEMHIQLVSYENYLELKKKKTEGKYICQFPNGLWLGFFQKDGQERTFKKKSELETRIALSGQERILSGVDRIEILIDIAKNGTNPDQLEAIARLDIEELNDLLLENPSCNEQVRVWIAYSEKSTDYQLNKITSQLLDDAIPSDREVSAITFNNRVSDSDKKMIKKENLYERVKRGLST